MNEVTIEDLCKLMDWSRSGFYRRRNRKGFPPPMYRNMDGSIVFSYAAVKRWAKSSEVKPRKGRA